MPHAAPVEQRTHPCLPEYLEDEGWQRLVADIDHVVRIFVEQRDLQQQLPNLRLRVADLEVEHLKAKLRRLKYSLQHDLERLEERVRLVPDDEVLRHQIALGAERWTDIWIMESLLDRLTNHPEQSIELADGCIKRKLPAPVANESDAAA